MSKIKISFLLAFVITVAWSTACRKYRSPTTPDSGTPLPQQTLYDYKSSGITVRRNEAIRDAARWQAVWAELHIGSFPVPPVPAVDFSRDMVVLAALGTTQDSCFSIAVASVVATSSLATVGIEISRFPPNCTCPPFSVTPAHAVKVRRTDTP